MGFARLQCELVVVRCLCCYFTGGAVLSAYFLQVYSRLVLGVDVWCSLCGSVGVVAIAPPAGPHCDTIASQCGPYCSAMWSLLLRRGGDIWGGGGVIRALCAGLLALPQKKFNQEGHFGQVLFLPKLHLPTNPLLLSFFFAFRAFFHHRLYLLSAGCFSFGWIGVRAVKGRCSPQAPTFPATSLLLFCGASLAGKRGGGALEDQADAAMAKYVAGLWEAKRKLAVCLLLRACRPLQALNT